jgi:hypothetical protein
MWMLTMDLLIRTMTDKWQTQPLVREGAPIEQDCNFHLRKKKFGHGPQEGARYQDLLTDWSSVAIWLGLGLGVSDDSVSE